MEGGGEEGGEGCGAGERKNRLDVGRPAAFKASPGRFWVVYMMPGPAALLLRRAGTAP